MLAGKSRPQIQKEIKAKEAAQERIAREYQRLMKKDELKWLLYRYPASIHCENGVVVVAVGSVVDDWCVLLSCFSLACRTITASCVATASQSTT